MLKSQGTIEEQVQAIRGTQPKPKLSSKQKEHDKAVLAKAAQYEKVISQEDDWQKQKEQLAKEWEQAQRTLFPEHPDRKALVAKMRLHENTGSQIREAKARLRDLIIAHPRPFGKNWNTANDRVKNTNILRSIDQYTRMIEDLKGKLIPPYMV